jgi:hypothetical protein
MTPYLHQQASIDTSSLTLKRVNPAHVTPENRNYRRAAHLASKTTQTFI